MIVIVIIFLLTLEALFLWDFILQLGELNEALSNNNCKWQTKTITHLKLFFPKKDKRKSFTKVTPEYLYKIVFAFQITLYILFLVSLINSFICLVLYYLGIIKILNYWAAFTFIDMLISAGILSVAYFIIHKECKRLSACWRDFS